ncbi:MAG: hypothetical protein IJI49_04760 [Bacilli bacterium]|nr:hypothetical protein [Bacilli bacterium]
MINKFFLVIRKIIISALFIYGYDSLMLFTNHTISINSINLLFISYFGIIGMFYLIIFSFI